MLENKVAEKIFLILTILKSKEIIDFSENWNINKLKLLTLVIESKISYDEIINDVDCRTIIEDLDNNIVYNKEEYHELTSYVTNMNNESEKNSEKGHIILRRLFDFHKMLYKTGMLVIKLLDEKLEKSNKKIVINPRMDEIAETFKAHADQRNFIAEFKIQKLGDFALN